MNNVNALNVVYLVAFVVWSAVVAKLVACVASMANFPVV